MLVPDVMNIILAMILSNIDLEVLKTIRKLHCTSHRFRKTCLFPFYKSNDFVGLLKSNPKYAQMLNPITGRLIDWNLLSTSLRITSGNNDSLSANPTMPYILGITDGNNVPDNIKFASMWNMLYLPFRRKGIPYGEAAALFLEKIIDCGFNYWSMIPLVVRHSYDRAIKGGLPFADRDDLLRQLNDPSRPLQKYFVNELPLSIAHIDVRYIDGNVWHQFRNTSFLVKVQISLKHPNDPAMCLIYNLKEPYTLSSGMISNIQSTIMDRVIEKIIVSLDECSSVFMFRWFMQLSFTFIEQSKTFIVSSRTMELKHKIWVLAVLSVRFDKVAIFRYLYQEYKRHVDDLLTIDLLDKPDHTLYEFVYRVEQVITNLHFDKSRPVTLLRIAQEVRRADARVSEAMLTYIQSLIDANAVKLTFNYSSRFVC